MTTLVTTPLLDPYRRQLPYMISTVAGGRAMKHPYPLGQMKKLPKGLRRGQPGMKLLRESSEYAMNFLWGADLLFFEIFTSSPGNPPCTNQPGFVRPELYTVLVPRCRNNTYRRHEDRLDMRLDNDWDKETISSVFSHSREWKRRLRYKNRTWMSSDTILWHGWRESFCEWTHHNMNLYEPELTMIFLGALGPACRVFTTCCG